MTILQEIRKRWKPRKAAAHKGDFGKIFIVAGSRGLAGAAHLAGMAALRTGAGLVTVGVPEKIYNVVARREAEVMVRPFASTAQGTFAMRALPFVLDFLSTQDILALGPGLSQHRETQKFAQALISKSVCPVVIDADGLNALKGQETLLRTCSGRAILTPHPGEFCRMFGGKLSARDGERKRRATDVAKRFGIILVLKGHHTVVAEPGGKIQINTTGNPGMASGGTGDVLTGMIAALLGQGFSLWDAARFGVYLHGLAGDLAARCTGEVSMIAGDLLENIPAAIKKVIRR